MQTVDQYIKKMVNTPDFFSQINGKINLSLADVKRRSVLGISVYPCMPTVKRQFVQVFLMQR